MGLEIHVKSNIPKRFHTELFFRVPWIFFSNNHFRCFVLEHQKFANLEFKNFLFNLVWEELTWTKIPTFSRFRLSALRSVYFTTEDWSVCQKGEAEQPNCPTSRGDCGGCHLLNHRRGTYSQPPGRTWFFQPAAATKVSCRWMAPTPERIPTAEIFR